VLHSTGTFYKAQAEVSFLGKAGRELDVLASSLASMQKLRAHGGGESNGHLIEAPCSPSTGDCRRC
jgi:hypothetical protein